MDGRTGGRTFETHFIRSCRRSRPKSGRLANLASNPLDNAQILGKMGVDCGSYRLIGKRVGGLHVLSDGDCLRGEPLHAGCVRQPAADVPGRRVGQRWVIFDAEYHAELHRVVGRRNERAVGRRSDTAHRVEVQHRLVATGVVQPTSHRRRRFSTNSIRDTSGILLIVCYCHSCADYCH